MPNIPVESRGVGRPALLFLFLVGLILAVTWPWARTFSTGFLVHWDPPFHAWKLNLVAESILQGHVFPPERTTNVFFPSSLTLYYEALHWPQAVLAAALRLFTDNVVLVYHLVMVAFWAFSGLCAYWLLRELGAGESGAVLGAAVFVVMPFRASYVIEFNMQLCAGMVLFLLFLFRFLRQPDVGNALGLSLGFWFQAASELYLALIMALVLPMLVAPSLRALPVRGLTLRRALGIGAALLAGGALTWYFLWPYLVLKQAENFTRDIEEMGHHFVEPLSYLLGTVSRVLLPWVHRIRHDELSVYPGALVLVGALFFGVSGRRMLRRGAPGRDRESRFVSGLRALRLVALALVAALAAGFDLATPGQASWAVWLFNAALILVPAATLALALAAPPGEPSARARSGLAGAAALAFVLSLGPQIVTSDSGWSAPNLLFGFMYRHAPLLGGMRVVSRFAIVALLFLLVAAIAGWETLCRRWRIVRWAAPLLVALICVESRAYLRQQTVPFAAPWRSPALAAMEQDPAAPLLVLPMGDRNWDGQYMLGIAGSRRRLLYGWGGFYPPLQRDLERRFGGGDFAGGVALLREIWPSPYILVDRLHVQSLGRRDRARAPWDRIQEELAAAGCEMVAADERFVLLKVAATGPPAEVHRRVTRHDVLAENPVVVLRARSASDGPVPAALAVNGSLLGRFAVSKEARTYALAVPPAALERVYPNTVQVGATDGGQIVLEAFSLLPAGRAPADAAAVAADSPTHPGEPSPRWLGSLTALPAGAIPAAIDFDGGVSLLGYEVAPERARPGETVEVTYFLGFDPRMPFSDLPVLRTHALAGERIVAQDCFAPKELPERSSVRAQPYRKVFRAPRPLMLPADAPAGRYAIRVGLQQSEFGHRVAGRSALEDHHRWFTLPGGLDVGNGGR